MALLSHLTIENVRNIREAALSPSPGINFIVGPNASGKSTLIESIYYLGRARSYRDRHWRAVRQKGGRFLRITGRMKSDTGRETVLGVERNDKELKIRIGGQPVDSARALVEALPILLVHPESHRLVAEGPAHRRQFLDWGVFHVEPTFHAIWNRYRKALNQRNAVLKQGLSVGQLGPWEKEMEEAATALDLLRKKYMEELGPHFLRLGSELLEGQEVLLHYRRGWPESVKLSVVLQETREGDRKLGYTRYGPHRADLTLLLGRDRAVTVASRGQQKLLLLSLILAQAELLSQRRSQKRPILLIDDLPSELDASRLNKVLKVLDSLQYQTFVTGTERSMFPPEIVECSRTFHVEHGRIEPMV